MHIGQWEWSRESGWKNLAGAPEKAELVLLFGGGACLRDPSALSEIRDRFPTAVLAGCSTAGEIMDTSVHDDSLVATTVQFESTRVTQAWAAIGEAGSSYNVGARLARSLDHTDLRHVFVLSDGLSVNGSELVRGLADGLPANVSMTGGLSGDGDRFQETYVIAGDRAVPGIVSAVGLHGAALRVGCASLGGWDTFGPERMITRSEGNVLYEMDGKPALDLYRRYLGEHADGLPGTGLLFPLSIRTEETDQPLVRTILAINEAEGSLTFAGDVPEGAYSRLMRANFNRLIDGAAGAARATNHSIGSMETELAILISCVGRKMVLRQRVEEELEGVRDVLGPQAALTGFYSYGEISPFTPNARCELHNQTMTITALAEVA